MDFSKIIKGKHYLSFIGQLSTAVIAMVAFMILARGFSKEEFGQWILYLSFLTFADMVKSGMVQSAFIKYASGAKGGFFAKFQGSSWLLNVLVTTVISALCFLIYYFGIFDTEGIVLFFLFYPIYSFVSMPFQYFLWTSQIKLDFKKVAIGRTGNVLLFLTASLSTLIVKVSVQELVVFHLLAFGISSLTVVTLRLSGIKSIIHADISTIRRFWLYGRFHSLAFLGSNLLKSSDTFIIGGVLGPVFVAVYAIPLRLVEIIELPLRASSSVAFPMFSNHDNKKDYQSLRASLEKYIGVLSLLYIPFMLLLFLLSDYLVLIVGGEKYAAAGSIFRLFLIYGLFLPFDRYTGVVLDAMGYPKMNFHKVVVMAFVNIVGDVVVLYFFRSLEMVALVTILNVICGTIVGFYLVNKKLNISIKSIISSGLLSIKQSIIHLKFLKYEN